MPGIDPITAIGNATDTLLSIVNKFVPDKAQAAQASAEIQKELIAQIGASDVAQAGTNTAEAANNSLFVAGWRPAFGWVCVATAAWGYLLQPMFSCFWTAFTHQPAPVPAIDLDSIMFILSGLLGLGGMRTFEKVQGVATNAIGGK